MKSIDKTIILMLGRAFGSSTVMLISIMLARSLSKADYGTYVQTSMLVQLAGFLLTLGIPSSITYFLPKAYDKSRLIARSYLLMLAVGCLGAISLFGGREYLARFFNNHHLGEFVMYAAFGVFFFLSSQLTRPILMYARSTLLLAKIEILRSVLFLAAMMACALLSVALSTVILILTASFFFDFVVSVLVALKAVSANRGTTSPAVPLGEQIGYSFPLGSLAFCWYAGRELDKYVISHYMNPDRLALYSRGAIEIPLVHILASTISQLKLPDWVAQWDRGSSSALIEGWHHTIVKASLIIFPAFVFLEILGREFIALLYSDQYLQSAEIFHIYLLMLPLQVTSYTAIVESTGKNRVVLIGYLVQLPVSLVLSAVSVRYFEWSGPALVSVLSMYLWTGYLLFVIARIFKLKLSRVFPWRRLGSILLVAVVAGVLPGVLLWGTGGYLATLIPQKELLHGFHVLVYFALYAACYGTLALRFTLFDPEDVETMSRWLLLGRIKRALPGRLQSQGDK
ncbi:hypothetical protein GMLC_01280 [Geomonas limicola]|uniref:Uncharacterized protein n=1 Tax=Geomonas limicola TaxID=2740186 RepID=A0A6V8N5H4_9BACT|nr:lipopolysaccharide biosynthesis protein [Geomonas limicola]GFO66549.1 hypothetical protein GMLC_01280 [Geomonas limicola]